MNLTVSKPYDKWSQFPKSIIPIIPVIDSFWLSQHHPTIHPKFKSVFFHKNNLCYVSGRYAIANALDIMGINSSDSVLIPSYHCLSMVSPVVWSGAEPRFYKLNKDLSVDIKDIQNKISSTTKAIMVTHFFGFPQKLSEVIQVCKKNNIRLIEDCAHAFFGNNGTEPIGTAGDFAVASLKKFFPVVDGGVLINNSPLSKKVVQDSVNIIQQLKYAVNMLEESISYNRLKLLIGVFTWLNILRNGCKNESVNRTKELSDELKIKSWFDPARKTNKNSYISQFLIKYSDTDKICIKRIQNYLYLLNNFIGLKSVVPLYPKLKQGVVPYMFPLILKQPETDFRKLKMDGVPIWRWEELCLSDCKNSRFFSRHLIQLPCHQSLRRNELNSIIQAVRELDK